MFNGTYRTKDSKTGLRIKILGKEISRKTKKMKFFGGRC
jgi:hypothetical protein